MGLEGTYADGVVEVGGDARQRLHDARGYGYPIEGNVIGLAPVEAAHLLSRGDLESVVLGDRRLGFRSFLTSDRVPTRTVDLLVYADLRSRGYYLVPAARPWVEEPPAGDFVVFERGQQPPDGDVESVVAVRDEREVIAATALRAGVLAVVDEESEVSYFAVSPGGPPGEMDPDRGLPADALEADLLDERVVVWEPPAALYEVAFLGRPLGEGGPLQCSLLEGAYLAGRGLLSIGGEAIERRGRSLAGPRFDRRSTVYRRLREGGRVPRTGYKFGADFRVYPAVESVEELDHSTHLVRVVGTDHTFDLRGIARDVRVAHGVRKTLSIAVVDGDEVGWWSLERLTP